MSAPYVVRNGNGEYLEFNLNTDGQGPFGAMILCYLRQGEYLSAHNLAVSLAASITGQPPTGIWYRTGYDRAIRQYASDGALKVGLLAVGDQCEVMEIVTVTNEPWGKLGRVNQSGVVNTNFAGRWAKLTGMTKV